MMQVDEKQQRLDDLVSRAVSDFSLIATESSVLSNTPLTTGLSLFAIYINLSYLIFSI